MPTNTYRCKDGKFVIIGGNGDSIFKRLMHAIGRPELALDPRMANNAGRVVHEKELDQAIGAWTGSISAADVLALLGKAEVPSGPIYSVVDMLADPHFNARGLFEESGHREALRSGMMPFLIATPGRPTGRAGGGCDNDEYSAAPGDGAEELRALARDGGT